MNSQRRRKRLNIGGAQQASSAANRFTARSADSTARLVSALKQAVIERELVSNVALEFRRAGDGSSGGAERQRSEVRREAV